MSGRGPVVDVAVQDLRLQEVFGGIWASGSSVSSSGCGGGCGVAEDEMVEVGVATGTRGRGAEVAGDESSC